MPIFNTSATIVAQASTNKPWQYIKHSCEIKEPTSAKQEGKIVSSEGDWLTEGSEQYKVAKEIFDTLTQKYGTSGAFAAGVIANAKGESGLTPDLGEG